MLNESKHNISALSRRELFFRLSYNHTHPPTHYLGDKRDIPLYTTNDTNIKDNIITQRQIQSIFDTRSRLLHQRAQRLNKTSQKIRYFIGQIVLDRSKLKENKTYTVNPDHYYVVTTIKQPRCGICLMTQHQCNSCCLKPSTSLGLLNLKTGNKTSRNASSLAPLNLDKILDTEFYLDLKNNSPYFAYSLNPYRYRQFQDQTEEGYNLRSKTTLEGQYGIIQEKGLVESSDTGSTSDNNKVKLYKGKPCKYVQTKYTPNKSAQPRKSILKTNTNENTMSLMGSLKDSLSADLLHSFIIGIQLSIQEILEPKNKHVREKNNLNNPQFFLYKAKQILSQYKKGQIILTLSNKISMKDLSQRQGARVKKIKILEEPEVSYYDEEDPQPLFVGLSGEEFLLLTNCSFYEFKHRKSACV